MSPQYIRLFPLEGRSRIHLVWPNRDYTICGRYTVEGDGLEFRKSPQVVKGPAKITCPYCRQVIEAVEEYIAATAIAELGQD